VRSPWPVAVGRQRAVGLAQERAFGREAQRHELRKAGDGRALEAIEALLLHVLLDAHVRREARHHVDRDAALRVARGLRYIVDLDLEEGALAEHRHRRLHHAAEARGHAACEDHRPHAPLADRGEASLAQRRALR
jgi:ribosomal protein S13